MDYKKKFIEVCQTIAPIINAIGQKGGKAYMVGGAVRDLVLRYKVKDIDIEVHAIMLDDLVATLSCFGHVREVGKQFGVIRIDGCDIDWSLPRKDSKGRKPEVVIDPSMTLKDACRRRDLTMNALAVDMHQVCALIDQGVDSVESMSIIDFYGGLADIAAKRLAAIDDQLFCEDPLRFFRVMQFIGRFEMQPTESLNKLCARMSFIDQVRNVAIAKERIYEEIKKLLLKSRAPSLGFRWLLSIGRLNEIFPELYALVAIQQRPDYHPEGSAFEHTMQTLDAAACYEHYQAWNMLSAEDEKLMVLCAALMHDLGKAVTTDARLSCHGHERAGVAIAQQMMQRLTNEHVLISAVKKLVLYHGLPIQLAQSSSLAKFKKYASKLAPECCLRHIFILARADLLGRNAARGKPLDGLEKFSSQDLLRVFFEKSLQAGVLNAPEPAILHGRDFLDVVKPGPEIGRFVAAAYELQINEGISDSCVLKNRVLKKK